MDRDVQIYTDALGNKFLVDKKDYAMTQQLDELISMAAKHHKNTFFYYELAEVYDAWVLRNGGYV